MYDITYIMNITPEYLAGFFDADGCVGIYRRGGNSYQVCVAIANSGKHGRVICNHLTDKFGGTVTTTKAKSTAHRDVFWFKLNGKSACKRFLTYIRDYSIIKKDQIELCLDFIAWREGKGRYIKSDDEIDYMREQMDLCKKMKREC